MEELTYNIYCDESCHLENDGINVMLLGGVYCETSRAKEISDQIRAIKIKHGISRYFETKWTKVSQAKLAFYMELIDFFLDDNRLYFRGLMVPDKSILDHEANNQNHDDWYYKMYFNMLKYVFKAPNHYRVYVDIKDTCSEPKIRKLHDYLANKIQDSEKESIQRIQHIRSHESEILQLCDLIIGAIAYENRGLKSSKAKLAIISHLKEKLGNNSLSTSSFFRAIKFNLFVWQGRES